MGDYGDVPDERVEELRQLKKSVEDEWLARDDVVCVDVGFKEVGGRVTDELAIRVSVKVKRDVDERQRIPRTVRGVPTDVLERGTLFFSADAAKYTTLVGGISVGACSTPGTGTLGAIVRDATTMQFLALSNYHVLVAGLSLPISVAQPGPADNGVCPTDVFGRVERFAINAFVDCAVASIDNRTAAAAIAGGVVVTGAKPTQYGERVRKRGRTTGMTWGDVDTIDASPKLFDAATGLTRQFDRQIGIWRADGVSTVFGQAGDSGSAVLRWDGSICGLYMGHAGLPFWFPQGAYGYANRIGEVLNALNIVVATPPKNKEGKDGKEKDKDSSLEKLRKELETFVAGERAPSLALPEPVPGPLNERLQRLEEKVDRLQHFISLGDRPSVGDDG